MEAIPLSLYIHLPWCVRKCPYCDFNSHASDAVPESRYIDALIHDLEESLPLVWGRPVQTLFFGGGTPSLFSADGIATILAAVRARLRIPPNAEITLEANPGTIDYQRFQAFRDAGVNRLSIGIQSFDSTMLQRLGRIHDGLEAQNAIDAAKVAGFDNFNLDLMFALPNQSLNGALEDLRIATEFEPTHLSRYQLTLEPNTLFHHQPPQLPDEDLAWEMQQAGNHMLVSQGYRQYEVSAWAQDGKESRHNRNYWEFGDYLGIGAGAHGKLTDPQSGSIFRIWKHRHPEAYMQRDSGTFVAGQSKLDQQDLPFEFMLNALRLIEGVSRRSFSQRTGLADDSLDEIILQLVSEGLLAENNDRIVATERGQRYLNEVIARFLPPANV